MNQKHLARLAAFLVGALGGTALGDHHVGSPPGGSYVACSAFPIRCQVECNALNECRGRLGSESLLCDIEKQRLDLCVYNPPPPPPPPPPPACPAGQHFNDEGVCEEEPGCPEGQHTGDDGECQADHECGDDEIGGGSEECEGCGEGKAPNEDGTACLTCEHGERLDRPGQCIGHPCDRYGTDLAAYNQLKDIESEPKERLTFLSCKQNKVLIDQWRETTDANACGFDATFIRPPEPRACWVSGVNARTQGCNLSFVHTHPWFEWPKHKGKRCGGETIRSARDVNGWNSGGMDFSPADKGYANTHSLEAHLGVSDRSCVKVYRRHGGIIPVWGQCTPKRDLKKY